jgi:hypothetical protein
MALRMIGEMDGVDAFKKKTEVTHINKTGEELEKEDWRRVDDPSKKCGE